MVPRRWLSTLLLVSLLLVSFLSYEPGMAAAESLPQVYLVNVTLITTSDWTTISSDDLLFVNSRHVVVRGKDVPGLRVSQGPYGFGVNKEQFNDQLVETNMTLVVALSKCSQVRLSIQKGDIGYTYIRIVNLNSGTPVEVFEYNHTTKIEGDPTNRVVLDVSCEKLTLGGPIEIPRGGETAPKMVWAFYYPWYSLDRWETDPALIDTPLLGKYSSDDPRVIRAHIRLAKASGIDGFISSWWGEGSYTDQNLEKLLRISAEENFKVTIYLEILSGSGPRPPEEIKDMLRYFFENYADHPAYYHLHGKPVVFVWAANSIEPKTWREIFEDLRREGYDAFYIGNTLDRRYLGVFDGLHSYSTIDLEDIELRYLLTSLMCRTYPLLNGSAEPRVWAATMSPGYDDTHIPGREGYVQPRLDGEYYRETFEAALKSDPDWLLITSFNEFPENTFIEPSERYGFKYVYLTANFTAQFKGEEPDFGAIRDLEEKWSLESFSTRTMTSTSSTTTTTTQETSSSPTTSSTPSSTAPSTTESPSTSSHTSTPSSSTTTTTPEEGICGPAFLIVLAVGVLLMKGHGR